MMKHPFQPDTLSEITHHLLEVLESFGETCNEIWDKPSSPSPGEQTLSHVAMTKPRLHEIAKDQQDPAKKS